MSDHESPALARIEQKVDDLHSRLLNGGGIVPDHEKRLRSLEKWRGLISGAVALGLVAIGALGKEAVAAWVK